MNDNGWLSAYRSVCLLFVALALAGVFVRIILLIAYIVLYAVHVRGCLMVLRKPCMTNTSVFLDQLHRAVLHV